MPMLLKATSKCTWERLCSSERTISSQMYVDLANTSDKYYSVFCYRILVDERTKPIKALRTKGLSL